MRTFQLKNPQTVSVLGNTETGDYVVVDSAENLPNGDIAVKVVAKAEFEAAYVEVLPPAAPAEHA
jgi:SOS-response transcriptional repressor LexA